MRPPEGRVTFLFTDIEGSTRLLHELGEAYPSVLARHHEILQTAVDQHGGHVMGTEGDAFAVAFSRPEDAVRAALDAQLALGGETWPTAAELRVRMGIHTGPVVRNQTGYVGMALHEVARISSAAHGGQVLVSAESERRCLDLPGDVSFRDLGRHRLKDFPEPARLFQLEHPKLAETFPPIRALPEVFSNLPVSRTSFVGRTDELEAVQAAIETSPLTTVVGTGGAGKTRLAVEATRTWANALHRPSWFVDLVDAADEHQVLEAWARAFDLRPESDVRRTILDNVARVSGVVVVDNCEHVIEAAADLVEAVLQATSAVCIVATSREPLRLDNESVVTVGMLDANDARTLFLDRAAAASPGYAPSADESDAIDVICQRLDALPLAIELAAARIATLSAVDISRHLGERFRLLAASKRGGSQRHRTLRGAIEWSYELLPTEGQQAFRRLAVLPRPFPADVAAVVLHSPGEKPGDVLSAAEVIGDLVEKSLLGVERTEEGVRFGMLESLQSFGAEMLETAGETEPTWDRLVAWARDLAARFEGAFETAAWRAPFEEAQKCRNAVRAALQWALEHDRVDAAVDIVAGLGRFWPFDSDYLDAQRVCVAVAERLLDRPDLSLRETQALCATSAVLRSTGAALSSGPAIHRRSFEAARRQHGAGSVDVDVHAIAGEAMTRAGIPITPESLGRMEVDSRAIPSPVARGRALLHLGHLSAQGGPNPETVRFFDEAAAIAEALDHDPLRVVVFAMRAVVEFEDLVQAAAWLQEGIDRARSLRASLYADSGTFRLAHALVLLGELDAAEPYLAETEDFCRRVGDRVGLREALILRSRSQFARGDFAGARTLADQGIALHPEHDESPASLSHNLRWAATVYTATGDLAGAEALLDRVEAIEELAAFDRIQTLGRRVTIARVRGDWAAAHRFSDEFLALAADMEGAANLWLPTWVIDAAQLIAAQRPHDFAVAVRLVGFARPIVESPGWFKIGLDQMLEDARAALGDDAYEAEWEAGRALTLERAVDLARQATNQ